MRLAKTFLAAVLAWTVVILIGSLLGPSAASIILGEALNPRRRQEKPERK